MNDNCVSCKETLTEEVIWCYGCRGYICEHCDCLKAEMCWDCWDEEQRELEEDQYDPYDDYDPSDEPW